MSGVMVPLSLIIFDIVFLETPRMEANSGFGNQSVKFLDRWRRYCLKNNYIIIANRNKYHQPQLIGNRLLA